MAKITYLDKVALNENADIPDINKVKADDMNEIKNVVNGLIKTEKIISDEETYACNYINDVSGKILWTNPNPNNAISSALDIILSSGDYDFLEIITKQTTTDNRSYITKIPKGADGRIYVLTLNGICAVRNIRHNSDTDYTLGTISGGGETVDATWCIPIKIIGYKTGILS